MKINYRIIYANILLHSLLVSCLPLRNIVFQSIMKSQIVKNLFLKRLFFIIQSHPVRYIVNQNQISQKLSSTETTIKDGDIIRDGTGNSADRNEKWDLIQRELAGVESWEDCKWHCRNSCEQCKVSDSKRTEQLLHFKRSKEVRIFIAMIFELVRILPSFNLF